MPFNIPIEEDRSGEMIGQGLANAMAMYRQGAMDRQFRTEHAQDRAHMLQTQSLDDAIRQENARHAGIIPGAAPHENLDINVPDGLSPSMDHLPFETAMQPHPQGLASALGSQFQSVSGMPAPSAAPTTPGAFSMAGGGFHSPLKDQMSGGGAQQAGAPVNKQPQGGGAPAPSHTLHLSPSYQQLTPDYYSDSTAPGPVGAALALELGQEKTRAEIGELGARSKFYSEHGDYYEQGGYGSRSGATGAPHTLRTPNGYMLWDPQSRTYIPVDDENGKPVMPILPRPSTGLPASVRSARSAATASRADASAYDRRAGGFEHQLNDPMTQQLTDTTANFPALRDSASKYRAKGDSARQAAGLYDQQANRGSGLAAALPPASGGASVARPPGGNQGSTPAVVSPKPKQTYTRQQIDSLYQDAIKRGAPADKAKARRDQLMKTASP